MKAVDFVPLLFFGPSNNCFAGFLFYHNFLFKLAASKIKERKRMLPDHLNFVCSLRDNHIC